MRAESFLQDSVKSYLSEAWTLPVAHTRKQMAECQKLLGQTEEYPTRGIITAMSLLRVITPSSHPLQRCATAHPPYEVLGPSLCLLAPLAFFDLLHSYLQTSALLASDTHLSDSERKHFCQEILSFAGQSAGRDRVCVRVRVYPR